MDIWAPKGIDYPLLSVAICGRILRVLLLENLSTSHYTRMRIFQGTGSEAG
jgi:hypothetical protein